MVGSSLVDSDRVQTVGDERKRTEQLDQLSRQRLDPERHRAGSYYRQLSRGRPW
jgi:hypothetical protein